MNRKRPNAVISAYKMAGKNKNGILSIACPEFLEIRFRILTGTQNGKIQTKATLFMLLEGFQSNYIK